MMKILRAVAFATCFLAATAHAAPVLTAMTDADPWPVADLQDMTQAWYFTGAILAGPDRDGPPWAAERPRFGSPTLAFPPPAPAVALARVHVPPAIAEPPMASMLLVGAVVILLRVGRKEELFG
jgi:hypothetical protein